MTDVPGSSLDAPPAAPPPDADPRALVRMRDATVSYRSASTREALRGVSIRVAAGEWVVLVGPNGSGKSTALRLLATALRPTDGTVEHADASGRPLKPARARASMGVVFQQPALDARLTVAENLRTAARLYGIPGRAASERARAFLGFFDLTSRMDDLVGTLSGGQRRLVDLARALLHEPRLLLLDEPTVGLDPSARSAFLETLVRLRRDDPRALTVVISTHLLDETRHATRVAMMREGEVIADAPPDDLCETLGHVLLRMEPCVSEEARRLLADAGLEPRDHPDGVIAVLPDGDDPAPLLAGLASIGTRVTVAPPTLADVYEALAGRPIDADGGRS